MENKNIIELSIGKVELISALTWGQQEAIRNEILSGMKIKNFNQAQAQNMEYDASALSTAKYKSVEVCVKDITLNDGNKVKYSKEWLDNLSVADGDKLVEAVNEITNLDNSKKK